MKPSALFVVLCCSVGMGCGGIEEPEAGPASSSESLVGGQLDNSSNEMPGIVALIGQSPGIGPRAFCTGILISPRWVVTAAHCFDASTIPRDNLGQICRNAVAAGDRTKCEVDLGFLDWRFAHFARGGVLNRTFFHIHAIYRHSGYGGAADLYRNDVALVELVTEVPFTSSRRAGLWTQKWSSSLPTQASVVTGGWGFTGIRGEITAPSWFAQDTRRKVAALTYLGQDCSIRPPLPTARSASGTHVCAQGPQFFDHDPGAQTFNGVALLETNAGTCHGDGGGPLYYDSDVARVALGIASYPLGCALRSAPAFFTPLDRYLQAFRRGDNNPFNLPRPVKKLVTPGFWNSLVTRSVAAVDEFNGQTPNFAPIAGNFTNDGYADIVHYGFCGPTTNCFRAQDSQGGTGFSGRDFAGQVVFEGTHFYNRPVAGDFNGDGLSDIAYWGLCENSQPCWRVHQNSGGGSTVVRFFGGNARFAEDGPRSTPLVGDFNNDDYDDIAYSGLCADDAHGCWRVHLNGRNGSFVPYDYGGDIQFAGRDVTNTPMAGDFNGDGYDDIAYQGLCPEKCWRVHLNDRAGHFTVENYGAGMRFRNRELTSMPVAADLNGDGYADIAYSGICGDDNQPCLRTHLNAGFGAFYIEGHAEALFEGNDANNIPIVADFDGDGSADFGYFGTCNGSVCWRYHHLPSR